MPKKLLLIIFFTVLFLFYPGDSYYVKLFAYNRSLFTASKEKIIFNPKPIPYISNGLLQPQISAFSYYVLDLDSFTPILEKNIERQLSPASTAKVISSLVAWDYFHPDDILMVKREVTEGQLAGLQLGERLTFENVLYAVLVHSGNDAAYVLADNYPGGVHSFVAAMNKKAEALFMKDSHFKNPVGFDDFGQKTTAYDLSLAGRALLKNSELSRIVSTKSIVISDADFKNFHPLYNVNRLLGEIPGVGGLKTGKTEDAGENLITFYKKNQHNFLIVILGSLDRFDDTTRIVNWIDNNVGYLSVDNKEGNR